MSYEGYEQHICKNGHYFCVEATYSYDDDAETCHCKAPSVWWNAVDQTNGDDFGYIDMDKLELTPEVSQTCNLGHSHVVQLATYRIPSREEYDNLRTYRTEDGALHPTMSA